MHEMPVRLPRGRRRIAHEHPAPVSRHIAPLEALAVRHRSDSVRRVPGTRHGLRCRSRSRRCSRCLHNACSCPRGHRPPRRPRRLGLVLKRTEERGRGRSVGTRATLSSMARLTMSRVLRNGAKDDGSFDREFWRRVGAEGVFSAAWDMVREVRAFRGLDGDEPRLQRSVLRVVRRGG